MPINYLNHTTKHTQCIIDHTLLLTRISWTSCHHIQTTRGFKRLANMIAILCKEHNTVNSNHCLKKDTTTFISTEWKTNWSLRKTSRCWCLMVEPYTNTICNGHLNLSKISWSSKVHLTVSHFSHSTYSNDHWNKNSTIISNNSSTLSSQKRWLGKTRRGLKRLTCQGQPASIKNKIHRNIKIIWKETPHQDRSNKYPNTPLAISTLVSKINCPLINNTRSGPGLKTF